MFYFLLMCKRHSIDSTVSILLLLNYILYTKSVIIMTRLIIATTTMLWLCSLQSLTRSLLLSLHSDDGGHIIQVADGNPNKRDEGSEQQSPEGLAPLGGDREQPEEGNHAILRYRLQ